MPTGGMIPLPETNFSLPFTPSPPSAGKGGGKGGGTPPPAPAGSVKGGGKGGGMPSGSAPAPTVSNVASLFSEFGQPRTPPRPQAAVKAEVRVGKYPII